MSTGIARDIEAAIVRRDRGKQEKRKAQKAPTPTMRSKRVIKKAVRWEPPNEVMSSVFNNKSWRRLKRKHYENRVYGK
jgi:hypothetical protein